MRHSIEEKLDVIRLLLNGYSLRQLCSDLHLDHHDVSLWTNRYKKYGEEGLRNRPRNKNYTAKEKERIVLLHTQKCVPLQKLCLDYDISRASIKTWLRKVRRGDPLRDSKERPPKGMGRSKKKDPQTELEKLQAENLRLRAENALLKKVKALVAEQEARARLNGRKPSTN